MEKRLYRSRSDRMISGVCGGLANYFDIDPVIIRIVFVVLVFGGGAGILAYLIMVLVIPLEESSVTEPKEVVKENVAEMKEAANELASEVRSSLKREPEKREEVDRGRHGRSVLGIILVVIGIIFLVANFNPFWWFNWDNLWPLILIVIGLVIIIGLRRR